MATPTELDELERGDGAWENIQEVLRFGLRSLWTALSGVDDRIKALEGALVVQKSTSQRQKQHLEAIVQTLNAMSEQLNIEQEKVAKEQISMRLHDVERQLQDQTVKDRTAADDGNTTSNVAIAKIERRVHLLEEEMGHIVIAVDQKADAEAMREQQKTLEEAIRKRSKKDAFDQAVLTLQKQLELQRQDTQKELFLSISNAKAAQETLLHSTFQKWTAKTRETECENVQRALAQANQKQKTIMDSMHTQLAFCRKGLEAQQKRTTDVCVESEKQVRAILAATREEIAHQCSEAHGRIDFQFRTQEEVLAEVRNEQHKLREDMTRNVDERNQQITSDIAGAIEALDRRVLERQHQELETVRHQIAGEVQPSVANALKALESAKDREKSRSKQHQNLVGRTLSELDQMLQLIGRQLIQNTSQLQVVRNEQLRHSLILDSQNEDAEYGDDDFLLQAENGADNTTLTGLLSTSISSTPLRRAKDFEIENESQKDTEEMLARRLQHQKLQEKLSEKLRNYSQILQSTEQNEMVRSLPM